MSLNGLGLACDGANFASHDATGLRTGAIIVSS